MKVLFEQRDTDAKALVAWNNQQRVWNKVAENLSHTLQRPAEEMLTNNSYAFRRRVEDVNRIDLSVPTVVRVANASWEMSLRSGGAGGTRYVPVGSSYPYPLYCPIPSTDDMSPEHPAFMRVLASDPTASTENKLSHQPFYQQRYKEMSKYIRTKFAHVNPGVDENPFGVVGTKPPLVSEPIQENDEIDPVIFYPAPVPPPPQPGASTSSAPSNKASFVGHDQASVAETQKSVHTNSVYQSSAQQQPQQPQPPSVATPPLPSGPMLVLGASRLVFSASPGQLSVASLRVDNVGTTAVYYQWRVLPRDIIVPNHHAIRPHTSTSYFNLSDATSGVLLPEDEKTFSFSFMHPSGGIYTESWELLTVPAGVERIIITLRGVVVEPSDDVAARTRLRIKLESKLAPSLCRGFFTDIMNSEHHNVFRASAKESEIREQQHREAQLHQYYLEQQQLQKQTFLKLNAHLGVKTYYDSVIVSLILLHKNVCEHLNVDAALNPWDLSVRSLLEQMVLIPDPVVRMNMGSVFDAILVAAVVNGYAEETSLGTLILHGCIRRSFMQCADVLHISATTMKESLGLIDAPPRPGQKKGEKPKPAPKKPAAKGPAAGAKGGVGATMTAAAYLEEDPAKEPIEEYKDALPGMCRRALVDALSFGLTSSDQASTTVQHITQQPIHVSFSERLKEWDMTLAQQKMEAAKAAALAAGDPKKKK